MTHWSRAELAAAAAQGGEAHLLRLDLAPILCDLPSLEVFVEREALDGFA
ncbi:hypothetical protein K2O51_32010 (plasmid) [Cupriavidus pinatubonensis]|nr:hypothetical protein [Cupriavidus pinatubonensis]QYY34015.1 hypothetical protein K2O51_32010 [Cupriavidus pinatubonensis]